MLFVIRLASGRFFANGTSDGTSSTAFGAKKFRSEGEARRLAMQAGCTGFSIEAWE